jgi:hypothetical protein
VAAPGDRLVGEVAEEVRAVVDSGRSALPGVNKRIGSALDGTSCDTILRIMLL